LIWLAKRPALPAPVIDASANPRRPRSYTS
jgi:hypothetical protein